MPIIKRPQSSGTTNVVQIGAGNAATSATHIAQVTQQLGGSVAQLGTEYLNKAQTALSTAVYDLHMQKATEEFNILAQQRMGQTTDEDGNPNFASLPDDIEKIGNDVMMKRMATIFDPNASGQFTRDFRNFTSSQSLKAANVARSQELDYNRAQVKSTVSSTINKALVSDMAEADLHINDMKRSLDSYLASGAISKQEYDQQLDSTRSTIYKAKWGEVIEQDPNLARQILNNEVDVSAIGLPSTGLTEVERRQVLSQAEAKIVDNERAKQRVLKENEKNIAQQQKANYEEIKTSILAGKAGEADIIAAFNSGSIDQGLLNDGIQFARREADKQQATVDIQANLAQDIKDNKPLLDYTPKQVDDFINTQINLIEQGEGRELSITEKAQLVSSIDSPVNAVAKPIQHAALYGDDESTAEAYNAWSFLTDKKNVTVSGMNSQSQANMAMIDSLVRGSNLPVQEAVKAVRNINETRTPEKIDEISQVFKDEVDRDDMFDLANEIAGEGQTPIIGGFFTEDLQPGVSELLYNTLRTSYIETMGDIKAAMKLTETRTKDVLGTSNVGGRERIMFLAPEKMFPQLTGDQLDRIMRDEMGISDGVEVIIESDRSSRKIPGAISYAISVLDEDGIPKDVGRWAMDNETASIFLSTQTEAVDVEELKAEKRAKTKAGEVDKEATDILLRKIQRF
jgi:hypothetical protein